MISNPTSGYIFKKIENRDLNRYLHTHSELHSSITHNRQTMEATQVSINGRVEKHEVARAYHGILFSLKTEGNSDTCCDMNEP